MAVQIRPREQGDLPAMHRLYGQLHHGETTASLEEIERGFAAMSAFPGCEVFVVEDGDQVVGTFVLYCLPNMTRNGRMAAILENIVVDESRRREGIGRLMLAFARERAQARDCYKLSLTSNAARVEAHEFYRRCGMLQHGVSFRYVL